MSKSNMVVIIIGCYLACGWFIGLPLGALLDYVTKANRNNGTSIGASIMGWPALLAVTLLMPPLLIRKWLQSKLWTV